MPRIASIAAALAAVATVLAGGSLAAQGAKPFPEVIPLPIGFRPEGIEIGRGTTFYVGSVASGAIYRGDLRSGTVTPFVPGGSGKPATGGALGEAETISLSGDYAHVAGAFNLNGIDATRNGKTLVAVQSVTGKLFRIDPATGVAREISLGGENVMAGDGILL